MSSSVSKKQSVKTNMMTKRSQEKKEILDNIEIDVPVFNNSGLAKNIIDNMCDACHREIILKTTDIDISTAKDIFIYFERSVNENGSSKIMDDIDKMDICRSVKLFINNMEIIVTFLCDSSDTSALNIMSSVLVAIHTFCYMFPHNYNGLIIYVCLDNNKRDLPSGLLNSKETLTYLKTNSMAFNVSGATYRYRKLIVLTKKEEIIKLLFHELVHYAELDNLLMNVDIEKKWSIDKSINLSEAYTEYIAVLLCTAYSAIFSSTINNSSNDNIVAIYEKMINIELKYSYLLSASVLKFYDLSHRTLRGFFENKIPIISSPICIWEYVLIRTILLNDINHLTNITEFRLRDNTKQAIIDICHSNIYDNLVKFMKYPRLTNISYVCFDIDWTRI